MKISRSFPDGKRLYEIILSRNDFDDICGGCPDIGGFILGRHEEVYFHIFTDGDRFSDSWWPMDEGYFLNVGIAIRTLPPNVSREELDRLSQEHYVRLEQAINESGRIPIEDEIPLLGKINLGYVVLKVEPA